MENLGKARKRENWLCVLKNSVVYVCMYVACYLDRTEKYIKYLLINVLISSKYVF
jgi:hypothetical protein